MHWLDRFQSFFTERNCMIVLASMFIIMSIAVASVPYDPSTDLADATTHVIWVEQYSHGIHHIPYENWTYGMTQSVVVEYQGQYVVVNEKGPGHTILMLPFYMSGLGLLFGPTMMLLAIIGTYMLAKRLFGWQVGFIAALFVLSNYTVTVMWHRYYWTDASTMHLLVFAFWLLVEGIYRFNGRSLDLKAEHSPTRNDRLWGLLFVALSGLFFGLSVSTRYPTGLVMFAFLAYMAGFYLLRAWPHIRRHKKDFRRIVKEGMPFFLMLGAFGLGLLVILAPLTAYNSKYFGGPFNSGYDATTLAEFRDNGELNIRNTTSVWTMNFGSYISVALGNLIQLMPTFLNRIVPLLFLPLGIYCLRSKKLELAVLLLWMGINSFTYLSLQWVDMYARSNLVPWEPRYWMPSIPAVAIVAAVGVYRLANWYSRRHAKKHDWPAYERRAGKVILAGAVTGIILLGGLYPSYHYLQDPDLRFGPQPQHPLNVTTDMLLTRPLNFLDKPVIVQNTIITQVGPDTISIRSWNSTNPGSITVRFIDWPSGELPIFNASQVVTVRGMFTQPPAPPGMPSQYLIGVKYDTEDFARVVPQS